MCERSTETEIRERERKKTTPANVSTSCSHLTGYFNITHVMLVSHNHANGSCSEGVYQWSPTVTVTAMGYKRIGYDDT